MLEGVTNAASESCVRAESLDPSISPSFVQNLQRCVEILARHAGDIHTWLPNVVAWLA